MKNFPTYIAFLLALAAAAFLSMVTPAHAASKIEELKAACKENPTHAICQEREAKVKAAKERRSAKYDAAIQRVKENK